MNGLRTSRKAPPVLGVHTPAKTNWCRNLVQTATHPTHHYTNFAPHTMAQRPADCRIPVLIQPMQGQTLQPPNLTATSGMNGTYGLKPA
jgi:hypothetical protein